MKKRENGIYYAKGFYFSIQFVVTSQLTDQLMCDALMELMQDELEKSVENISKVIEEVQ